MTTRTDLIPAAEIARLAGVSRQRAHILATRYDFPDPAVESSLGKLWRRDQVVAFLATWERRSGRPRKPEAELSERIRNQRRRMAEREALAQKPHPA